MAEDSAKRRDWSPGPFLAHLNQPREAGSGVSGP